MMLIDLCRQLENQATVTSEKVEASDNVEVLESLLQSENKVAFNTTAPVDDDPSSASEQIFIIVLFTDYDSKQSDKDSFQGAF